MFNWLETSAQSVTEEIVFLKFTDFNMSVLSTYFLSALPRLDYKNKMSASNNLLIYLTVSTS